VPTILFEAGETGKFSRAVSTAGLQGVLNVLFEQGMWPERATKKPAFQVIVKQSDWLRAEKGGILDLAVRPGDLVYEGDAIGAILNPFGRTVTRIRATATGIVIGISAAPLSIPGSGLVHVARLKKTLARVERSIKKAHASRKRRKPRKERNALTRRGRIE
jgi:predicted deacylase